jgi:hypothetical protein
MRAVTLAVTAVAVALPTGNTGTEGRFYAKVGAKKGCKMDLSPTIQVQRPANCSGRSGGT